MKRLKIKIILLGILAITLLFFSNDFSIVDMEKAAIVTAIAIDKAGDKYEITAQIALPEANDTNTENQKTQLVGKGKTVASAVKNIADSSGWFPHLSFCNLIILGNDTLQDDCIEVLDYFEKSYRIQNSALVVLADGKASDVLKESSPLDHISSFAIQKVLLKALGFDNDTATKDIREFIVDYYSFSSSSFLPIIKSECSDCSSNQSGGGQSSSGGESGRSSGNTGSSGSGSSSGGMDGKGSTVFNASSTALYKKGFKVGELSQDQTLFLNALTKKIDYTTVSVSDENDVNYLFTIVKCTPHVDLKVTENQLTVNVKLGVYGKLTDENAQNNYASFDKEVPLPKEVENAVKKEFEKNISELFEISKESGCDFLEVGKSLYRYHYNHFARYKDNYLDKMKLKLDVNVSGQK